MTWPHLKTFLWVRGRILRNQAKRNSFASLLLQGALIVIPGIAGVVMFVAFLGVGLFVLQDVSPAVLMLVWDGLIGAFLLFWMIGLLTELQRSELLSIEKFLQLPVPPRSVFLINYLGSIVLTPCMIVFLPAMVGLTIGLVVSRGALMFGLFPLIVAFIVLVTAITYQFQGWLAALMVNKRRRRNIIAVATVGFVLVFQLPYLVGRFAESRSEPASAEMVDLREERRVLRIQIAALTQAADEEESREAERTAVLGSLQTYRSRVEVLTQTIDVLSQAEDEENFRQVERIAVLANRVIPLGWLPYGAMTLAESRVVPFLGGTVGLMLVGWVSLARSYRTTLRLYTGDMSATVPKTAKQAVPQSVPQSAPPASQTSSPLLERRLPWVSEHGAAITLACFRSLTRAPEAKMMLLTPVLMVVIFGGMSLNNDANPSLFLRPLLATGAFAVVLISLNQVAANQFGFDRGGRRVFVLGSAPRKDILLGKNLALLPLVLGLGTVVLVLVQWVVPMRVDHFLATLAQMLSMYLVYCLVANLLSIFAPMAIASGSLRPVGPKGRIFLMNLAFLFVFPLALAPTLLPLGIEWALARWAGLSGIPVYLLLTFVETAVVLFLFPRVLRWQGALLQAREQRILETVTAGVE